MLYISTCTHQNQPYTEICKFAKEVYHERYSVTLTSFPSAFAYAHNEDGDVVGCFGLSRATRKPLLVETYLSNTKPLMVLSGQENTPRNQLGEFGTRAIAKKSELSIRGNLISIALAAELFLYARGQGVRYALFTANRSVRLIAHALSVRLTDFGSPELKTQSESYLKNWEQFFKTPQRCYGVSTEEGVWGSLRQQALLIDAGFTFLSNHITKNRYTR